MARSSSSRQQRARAAQQQRSADAVRLDAIRRQQRKQRAIGVGVVVVVVLAVIGAFIGARNEQESKQAKASTTTASTVRDDTSTTMANTGPPASIPPVTAGAASTGTTACPAADGSAPRTTRFDGPPPTCIDPSKDYLAQIQTSKGPIQILLNAQQAPGTVNNFVVLARYHYYDGLPITRVVPRGWMEFGEVTNGDGTPGPGYRIPGEVPPQGSMASPVMVAMVPDSAGTSGGSFLIGIGDQSPAVPANATVFGLVLDSRVDPTKPVEGQPTVQALIDKIATPSGAPTEVVTIESVTITEEDRPA